MPVERRVSPNLAPPPGYAHVAIASGHRLVLTAGGVPLDAQGNLVGAGDVAAQTRQVIDNLIEQLQASPLSPAASTLLGVASLGYTGQLVEIEAIAALE